MASTSETEVFTRGALRRGFNAVLSTLASVDAPQAPQLVRGSCNPESAPGLTVSGFHAGQLHECGVLLACMA